MNRQHPSIFNTPHNLARTLRFVNVFVTSLLRGRVRFEGKCISTEAQTINEWIISQKFLNRFVELYIKQKEGLNLDLSIVVITDLGKKYTGTSKLPMEPTSSPAPFEGKNARECSELLQALVKDTGSEINVENFAILDERSKQDDTALLVQAFKKSGETKTVRGALKHTDMSLGNLWVGNMNIEEFDHQLPVWQA